MAYLIYLPIFFFIFGSAMPSYYGNMPYVGPNPSSYYGGGAYPYQRNGVYPPNPLYNPYAGVCPPKPGCTPSAVCSTDAECGTGKCFGPLIGKCDCLACGFKNALACQSDADCGGLLGACFLNGTVQTCNCVQAAMAIYQSLPPESLLPDFIQDITAFCTGFGSECSAEHHCFGLPCSRGICYCG